jgi:hypothetical protein
MTAIFQNSLFDGFTYGGLFTELERPGRATQVFADPNPPVIEKPPSD